MITVGISTQCCGRSPLDTIYLIVEPNPTLSFNGLFRLCPGDSVTITASGSNTYVWSPAAGLSTVFGPVVTADPAITTTYLVRGFSLHGRCTIDSLLTVTVVNPPTVTFTPNPATCGGNGSITANPNPAGAYNYLWSDPAAQTTQTATSLPAGSYSVTVVDQSSSCSVTGGVALGTGNGIQAFIDSSVNPNCYGDCNGYVRVKGILGSLAYTYLWSTNATTKSISNVCAGTYTVTVTDAANGCTATATITLGQPQQLNIEFLDTTNATCSTTADGSAFANAYGGFGPYQYLWNDPAHQDSAHAINLLPGTYTITVIDDHGCTAISSVPVTAPPASTSLSHTSTDVTCFGGNDGAIDLTITGTAGPYIIQWNTPNNDVTEDVSQLPYGFYTVQVLDSNNCAAPGGDSIQVNQPPQLVADTDVANISCFGMADGCITVNISGGVSPYNLVWSNASANNPLCSLSAGAYAFTVTDAHNCTVSLSNITIVEPPQLSASPVPTAVSCPGFTDGSVDAQPLGGTPLYAFNWNPGGTAGQTISNLGPGVYNVTVTDSRSCTATGTATVLQLPGIQISGTPHDVLCYPLQNGFIDISVVTVNPPATFLWTNGATTEDISSLAPGVYSVTITDQNNCQVDTSFTIFNDSIFSIIAIPPDTTIDLGESVQLQVIPTGDNIASLVWVPSNGLDCSDCISPMASPIQSINYFVTATSEQGCVSWDSVQIIVVPKYQIYIPNVFTPNGDGNNDFFEVFGNKDAWKQFEVEVFDRWGEKVYQSNDMYFKWDGRYHGTLLTPAVFVYQVKIVYLDNYVPKLYKGSVTLMR